MNESRLTSIAKRLLELCQKQVETLQQGTLTGLADGELKRYSERKQQALELHIALKTLRSRRADARPWVPR
jgi:hypothetical protein